jgi:glycine cleavage system H protein
MSIPADLKYSTSHEWVRLDGDVATCGITHHAQDALGDVVYVEMPEVGDDVSKGTGAAEIESVKAVSDIYAPVSGEVVEVNEAIEDGPEAVNADPYGGGWLFKVRITAPGEVDGLMDAKGYADHISAG